MDEPRTGLALRVNRTLGPVTTLGPGRRLGLWLQGCTLACPGCASQDTWDPNLIPPILVEVIADQIISNLRDEGLDGLTVTGGEPLQQAAALAELLRWVRPELGGSIPVLLFTGYPADVAQRRAPWLLDLCDVVVAGRFHSDQPGEQALVASTNQQVLHRNDAVRQMFDMWQQGDHPRIELTADEHDLYLVGVPRPGDLDRFAEAMARHGVTFDAVTWRP